MKRIFNTILFFTIFCLLSVQNIKAQISYQEKKTLAKEYFYKGNQALSKRDNSMALYWYQKTSILISNPSPLLNAGKAYLNLQLYSSAIYYFNEALNMGYGDKNLAYNYLSMIYAILGEDELGLEMAEKSNDKTPSKYNVIGGILERHGKTEEAIGNMHKAISLGYKKLPLYNIGFIYSEKNKPDSALFYLNKVIQAYPDFTSAYCEKACVLEKTGRPKEEYKNLCKTVIYLVSKEKERYENLELLAIAYKLLGDKQKMEKCYKLYIKELDKFIQLYPDAYPFILQRACSFENLGKKDAAIEDYRRVLELNTEYIKVKDKLNKLLNTKHNTN